MVCQNSLTENKLGAVIHKELYVWTRPMNFHHVPQKVDSVDLTTCCNRLFGEKESPDVLVDPDHVVTGAECEVFLVGRDGHVIGIE